MIYKGEQIQALPTYTIAKKGIGYVPEDQGIFAGLTVEENMKVAIQRENDETNNRLEYIEFVS